MREILFRGKRIDNGEWVEGYLYRISERLNPFIMLVNRNGESHEVDLETLCQYTGLPDKNKKRIWENDIVKIEKENDELFVVEWDNENSKYILTQNGSAMFDFGNYWTTEYEVIGNIFDNPEIFEQEGYR